MFGNNIDSAVNLFKPVEDDWAEYHSHKTKELKPKVKIENVNVGGVVQPSIKLRSLNTFLKVYSPDTLKLFQSNRDVYVQKLIASNNVQSQTPNPE